MALCNFPHNKSLPDTEYSQKHLSNISRKILSADGVKSNRFNLARSAELTPIHRAPLAQFEENESFNLVNIRRREKRRSLNTLSFERKSPRLEESVLASNDREDEIIEPLAEIPINVENARPNKRSSFMMALNSIRFGNKDESSKQHNNDTRVKWKQTRITFDTKKRSSFVKVIPDALKHKSLKKDTKQIEIAPSSVDKVCDLLERQELRSGDSGNEFRVKSSLSVDPGVKLRSINNKEFEEIKVDEIPKSEISIPEETVELSKYLSGKFLNLDETWKDQEDSALSTSKSLSPSTLDCPQRNIYSILQLHEYSEMIFFRLVKMDSWNFKDFRSDYLTRNNINVSLRSTLMDWLIKLQQYLRLRTESLHLAVMLTDRYTWLHNVDNSHYQLVAITAIFISTKYVERFPAKLKMLCHLTENAYTPSQVLHFERRMLMVLDFRLDLTLPVHLLAFALFNMDDLKNAEKESLEVLCLYFLDVSLTQEIITGHNSLIRMIAVIILGRRIMLEEDKVLHGLEALKKCLGLGTFLKGSGYELSRVINALCKHLHIIQTNCLQSLSKQTPIKLHNILEAAFVKFSHPKYNAIARHQILLDFDFLYYQTKEMDRMISKITN